MMNWELMKQKTDAYFASEQSTQDISECIDRINNRAAIKSIQIERFHSKYGDRLSEIIDKVVGKYNSDKYYYRWANRGIEPEEALYSFLLRYAEVYGRKLTEEEYIKYANMFTGGIYIIGDYVVNLMHGQGSCVMIDKVIK